MAEQQSSSANSSSNGDGTSSSSESGRHNTSVVSATTTTSGSGSSSGAGDAHHTRNESHEPHEHTTSVNRSFSDLDLFRFVFFAVLLAALRTALQHPLNLALARKQAMPHCAALSTRQVLTQLVSREGLLRGCTRGMAAYVGGTAASEGMYLAAFEAMREFLPISYDVTREAVSGYAADAVCRSVHIPLMVVAYRQMVFEPVATLKEGREGEVPTAEETSGGVASSSSSANTNATTGAANVNAVGGDSTCGAATATLQSAAPGGPTHPHHGLGGGGAAEAAEAAIKSSACSGAAATAAATAAVAGATAATLSAHHSKSVAAATTTVSSAAAVSSQAALQQQMRFRPPSTPRVAAAVYREGGVRALYAGLGTTLLIGCQWTGAWWAMYGTLKAPLYGLSDRMVEGWDDYDASGRPIAAASDGGAERGDKKEGRSYTIAALKTLQAGVINPLGLGSSFTKDDNMLVNGAASVLASASTAALFNPFLVVRTRMQTKSGLSIAAAAKEIYYEGFSGCAGSSSSSSSAVAANVRGGGRGSLRGFYRGLYLNISVCVLDGVLASLCYEYSKLWSDRSHLQAGGGEAN